MDVLTGVAFDPSGSWLVTANYVDAALWPLRSRHGRTLARSTEPVLSLAFTPNGDTLVSLSATGEVRVWPLGPGGTQGYSLGFRTDPVVDATLAVDPSGRLVAVTTRGGVLVAPLAGGPVLVGSPGSPKRRGWDHSPSRTTDASWPRLRTWARRST